MKVGSSDFFAKNLKRPFGKYTANYEKAYTKAFMYENA